jgi:hypothetical protein
LKCSSRFAGDLIGAREFGNDGAFSATEIETRGSVSKNLGSGLTVGIEMLGGSIGAGKYEVRYHTGISNRASDHNFGLRFNKAF